VDALVAAGHEVRAFDSLVPQVHLSGRPAYLNPAAEFMHADVCNPSEVRAALEGVDVVYHQAAEVGVGQSMYEIARYVKANDLGTAILLQEMIAKPRQFRKLVVASSMTIYGEGAYINQKGERIHPQLRDERCLQERQWDFLDGEGPTALKPIGICEDKPLNPGSVYAVSKQNQEQYCLNVGRAYNIPTVAFRYFNVYGPRQALSNPYTGVCAIFSARLLNDQRPLIFEDGEQSRDFVHVSDIVRANLLALETDRADYEAVNVGTGRAVSVREIASLLASGLGKALAPEIVAKYRKGDLRHSIADIGKARSLLGYAPRVNLEEGLAELLDWIRAEQPDDRIEAATAELAARHLIR
jgi:dTDP-L-rhamnose 4-epimerase